MMEDENNQSPTSINKDCQKVVGIIKDMMRTRIPFVAI
jgi:hypothetical protein